MRFFLGGVPFGENNIGDEAILAGAVSIIRRNFDNPEITVSTAKPFQTAELLNVNAVPLYGFRKSHPLEALRKEFKNHDVFVWSGATGLSDYPELAVKILTMAQECGLKTVVWGVGMDSALNPAFFKLGGKKLALCSLASRLSLKKIDFVKLAEDYLTRVMKRKIAAALLKCDLVVVRDTESALAVKTCSPEIRAIVGADSATIFTSADTEKLSHLPETAKAALFSKDFQKIGLCISAQRMVSDMDSLAAALDSLIEAENRRMFLLAMNPRTDSVLMESLKQRMRNKDKVFSLKGCEQPEHILAAASQCDVVVSSRLHLLILAANVSTPIVGISRGSKVDNFLGAFGLSSPGTVNRCNFALLRKKTEALLADPSGFKAARDKVYEDFAKRLGAAEELLKSLF